MHNVTMNGFKRVNRKIARKLNAQGERVWLTNCKLIPANMYNWMAIHQFDDGAYTFDSMINNWTYYNANNEWGYYPAFYVKA